MTTLRRTLSRALVPAAIALLAAPFAAHADTPAATAAEPDPAAPLWKIADEDTTIYLFGTVHVLTEGTRWYDQRIESALSSADTFVTELPLKAMEGPEAQKHIMAVGLLPAGTTLRGMLSAEQRTAYEGALTKLGLPAAAFDQMEPWLAGLTLSVVPLLQKGFKVDSGVEKVLDGKVAPTVKRDAVETMEGQMNLFDGLPIEGQIAFLMAAVESQDKIVPGLGAMVDAWKAGDADKLAQLMNENMGDPALADRLLYARNRNWAEWIDTRLDTPGTVFMAVGAGHLAGEKSVQDYLDDRGIEAKRIR